MKTVLAFLFGLSMCVPSIQAQCYCDCTIDLDPPAYLLEREIQRHVLFELFEPAPQAGHPLWQYRTLLARGSEVQLVIGLWQLEDSVGITLASYDRMQQTAAAPLLHAADIQLLDLSLESFYELCHTILKLKARVPSLEGGALRKTLIYPFSEAITLEAGSGSVRLWLEKRTPVTIFYSETERWLEKVPRWLERSPLK